jgi:anaerobic magnesium-protoporphyrin IX monomethyl ester cyclase
MSRQTSKQTKDAYVVALIGISQPGYRCLANGYLRESLKQDGRLPSLALATLEFDTTVDAWWIVYDVLALQYPPDVLCFSVYCWNARIVYEVLDILYEVRPDAKIVLGGPEVGPIADELHKRFPRLTYIVKGEGEQAICDVIHALTHERDLALLPQREPIANLDTIPSPYSDAYPPAIDGSAYIETFRGCPHACSYCYEGKGVSRIRSFSWDRIEKDIKRLATTPGMKSFSFVDSVFNLTKDRLQRLSDILAPYARRGLRLHTIEVDIESIDDEQAALLKRAGVVSVETGPQTTGKKALALCNRTLDSEAYLRGIEACKRVGIRVEADLIIGLPGDTVSDVLESFQFVVDADPGIIQASTLHVLPGTQLWDQADELGLHFDKNPPHEVIKTADISYTDLRNLEVFGLALGALYRARL